MKSMTEAAIVRRVNRVLRADGEMLRRTREGPARHDLGEWWIHNFERNYPAATDVDPAEVAKELGVL